MHYGTCFGSSPFSASLSHSELITDKLSTAISNVLLNSTHPSCRENIFLKSANNSVIFIYSNISKIESAVACDPIQRLWNDLFNVGLCGHFYMGMFWFAITAYVLLFVLFLKLLAAIKLRTSLELIKDSSWSTCVNIQQSCESFQNVAYRDVESQENERDCESDITRVNSFIRRPHSVPITNVTIETHVQDVMASALREIVTEPSRPLSRRWRPLNDATVHDNYSRNTLDNNAYMTEGDFTNHEQRNQMWRSKSFNSLGKYDSRMPSTWKVEGETSNNTISTSQFTKNNMNFRKYKQLSADGSQTCAPRSLVTRSKSCDSLPGILVQQSQQSRIDATQKCKTVSFRDNGDHDAITPPVPFWKGKCENSGDSTTEFSPLANAVLQLSTKIRNSGHNIRDSSSKADMDFDNGMESSSPRFGDYSSRSKQEIKSQNAYKYEALNNVKARRSPKTKPDLFDSSEVQTVNLDPSFATGMSNIEQSLTGCNTVESKLKDGNGCTDDKSRELKVLLCEADLPVSGKVRSGTHSSSPRAGMNNNVTHETIQFMRSSGGDEIFTKYRTKNRAHKNRDSSPQTAKTRKDKTEVTSSIAQKYCEGERLSIPAVKMDGISSDNNAICNRAPSLETGRDRVEDETKPFAIRGSGDEKLTWVRSMSRTPAANIDDEKCLHPPTQISNVWADENMTSPKNAKSHDGKVQSLPVAESVRPVNCNAAKSDNRHQSGDTRKKGKVKSETEMSTEGESGTRLTKSRAKIRAATDTDNEYRDCLTETAQLRKDKNRASRKGEKSRKWRLQNLPVMESVCRVDNETRTKTQNLSPSADGGNRDSPMQTAIKLRNDNINSASRKGVKSDKKMVQILSVGESYRSARSTMIHDGDNSPAEMRKDTVETELSPAAGRSDDKLMRVRSKNGAPIDFDNEYRDLTTPTATATATKDNDITARMGENPNDEIMKRLPEANLKCESTPTGGSGIENLAKVRSKNSPLRDFDHEDHDLPTQATVLVKDDSEGTLRKNEEDNRPKSGKTLNPSSDIHKGKATNETGPSRKKCGGDEKLIRVRSKTNRSPVDVDDDCRDSSTQTVSSRKEEVVECRKIEISNEGKVPSSTVAESHLPVSGNGQAKSCDPSPATGKGKATCVTDIFARGGRNEKLVKARSKTHSPDDVDDEYRHSPSHTASSRNEKDAASGRGEKAHEGMVQSLPVAKSGHPVSGKNTIDNGNTNVSANRTGKMDRISPKEEMSHDEVARSSSIADSSLFLSGNNRTKFRNRSPNTGNSTKEQSKSRTSTDITPTQAISSRKNKDIEQPGKVSRGNEKLTSARPRSLTPTDFDSEFRGSPSHGTASRKSEGRGVFSRKDEKAGEGMVQCLPVAKSDRPVSSKIRTKTRDPSPRSLRAMVGCDVQQCTAMTGGNEKLTRVRSKSRTPTDIGDEFRGSPSQGPTTRKWEDKIVFLPKDEKASEGMVQILHVANSDHLGYEESIVDSADRKGKVDETSCKVQSSSTAPSKSHTPAAIDNEHRDTPFRDVTSKKDKDVISGNAVESSNEKVLRSPVAESDHLVSSKVRTKTRESSPDIDNGHCDIPIQEALRKDKDVMSGSGLKSNEEKVLSSPVVESDPVRCKARTKTSDSSPSIDFVMVEGSIEESPREGIRHETLTRVQSKSHTPIEIDDEYNRDTTTQEEASKKDKDVISDLDRPLSNRKTQEKTRDPSPGVHCGKVMRDIELSPTDRRGEMLTGVRSKGHALAVADQECLVGGTRKGKDAAPPIDKKVSEDKVQGQPVTETDRSVSTNIRTKNRDPFPGAHRVNVGSEKESFPSGATDGKLTRVRSKSGTLHDVADEYHDTPTHGAPTRKVKDEKREQVSPGPETARPESSKTRTKNRDPSPGASGVKVGSNDELSPTGVRHGKLTGSRSKSRTPHDVADERRNIPAQGATTSKVKEVASYKDENFDETRVQVSTVGENDRPVSSKTRTKTRDPSPTGVRDGKLTRSRSKSRTPHDVAAKNHDTTTHGATTRKNKDVASYKDEDFDETRVQVSPVGETERPVRSKTRPKTQDPSPTGVRDGKLTRSRSKSRTPHDVADERHNIPTQGATTSKVKDVASYKEEKATETRMQVSTVGETDRPVSSMIRTKTRDPSLTEVRDGKLTRSRSKSRTPHDVAAKDHESSTHGATTSTVKEVASYINEKATETRVQVSPVRKTDRPVSNKTRPKTQDPSPTGVRDGKLTRSRSKSRTPHDVADERRNIPAHGATTSKVKDVASYKNEKANETSVQISTVGENDGPVSSKPRTKTRDPSPIGVRDGKLTRSRSTSRTPHDVAAEDHESSTHGATTRKNKEVASYKDENFDETRVQVSAVGETERPVSSKTRTKTRDPSPTGVRDGKLTRSRSKSRTPHDVAAKDHDTTTQGATTRKDKDVALGKDENYDETRVQVSPVSETDHPVSSKTQTKTRDPSPTGVRDGKMTRSRSKSRTPHDVAAKDHDTTTQGATTRKDKDVASGKDENYDETRVQVSTVGENDGPVSSKTRTKTRDPSPTGVRDGKLTRSRSKSRTPHDVAAKDHDTTTQGATTRKNKEVASYKDEEFDETRVQVSTVGETERPVSSKTRTKTRDPSPTGVRDGKLTRSRSKSRTPHDVAAKDHDTTTQGATTRKNKDVASYKDEEFDETRVQVSTVGETERPVSSKTRTKTRDPSPTGVRDGKLTRSRSKSRTPHDVAAKDHDTTTQGATTRKDKDVALGKDENYDETRLQVSTVGENDGPVSSKTRTKTRDPSPTGVRDGKLTRSRSKSRTPHDVAAKDHDTTTQGATTRKNKDVASYKDEKVVEKNMQVSPIAQTDCPVSSRIRRKTRDPSPGISGAGDGPFPTKLTRVRSKSSTPHDVAAEYHDTPTQGATTTKDKKVASRKHEKADETKVQFSSIAETDRPVSNRIRTKTRDPSPTGVRDGDLTEGLSKSRTPHDVAAKDHNTTTQVATTRKDKDVASRKDEKADEKNMEVSPVGEADHLVSSKNRRKTRDSSPGVNMVKESVDNEPSFLVDWSEKLTRVLSQSRTSIDVDAEHRATPTKEATTKKNEGITSRKQERMGEKKVQVSPVAETDRLVSRNARRKTRDPSPSADMTLTPDGHHNIPTQQVTTSKDKHRSSREVKKVDEDMGQVSLIAESDRPLSSKNRRKNRDPSPRVNKGNVRGDIEPPPTVGRHDEKLTRARSERRTATDVDDAVTSRKDKHITSRKGDTICDRLETHKGRTKTGDPSPGGGNVTKD